MRSSIARAGGRVTHGPRNALVTAEPSKTNRGSSSLEVIVTLVILGVILVVALARFADAKTYGARLAAKELAASLRYTRTMAMNRDRAVRVVFSVVSNRYAVALADTNAAGGYSPVKDPSTQGAWITDIGGKYAGVRLQGVSIGGGDTLLFSPTNGIPCNALGQPLTTPVTVTFQPAITVSVTPHTGYVSISE